MRVSRGLEDYCLWELSEVMEGIKKAGRLLAGQQVETPEEWFKRKANGG